MCTDCGLETYSYGSALKAGGFQIRLLRLHPARPKEADIVVELRVKNEAEAPYEAISWCWGTVPPRHPIRIRDENGDFCFKVTKNLEQALRRLRLPDKYRTIWIDTICIHQNDLQEKSRQVALMSEIYGRAQRVLIWLGDEDAISRRAFAFIQDHLLLLQKFDRLCQESAFDEDWMSLIRFTERPWFSRRWVIQEIALADQHTATIFSGRDEITWSQFSEAILLLDQALKGPLNLSRLFARTQDVMAYSTRAAPALGAIRLIRATSALSRKNDAAAPRAGRSLEYLVTSFTMFETSNSHDIIYALLSVSSDAFRLNPQSGSEMARDELLVSSEGPSVYLQKLMLEWWESHTAKVAFLVDYEAPYVAVYRRFISFCISNASPFYKLDILCRPWAPEPGATDEVVPSWICTMATSAHRLVEREGVGKRLVRRNADSLVGMPGTLRYNASYKPGPTTGNQVFRFHESVSRSMFVKGFILSELETLELPSQLGNIPPEWLKLVNWHNRGDLPPEEFWRTLVANRNHNNEEPPPFYPRACREIFQDFVDDTLDISTMLAQGSTIITEFLSRVQAVIWNRRLMRTRTGFLGLVPKNALYSDFIAILDGCSVPVVLRKHFKTKDDLDLEARDDADRQQNAVQYVAKQLVARYRERKANRIARAAQRAYESLQEHAPKMTWSINLDKTNIDASDSASKARDHALAWSILEPSQEMTAKSHVAPSSVKARSSTQDPVALENETNLEAIANVRLTTYSKDSTSVKRSREPDEHEEPPSMKRPKNSQIKIDNPVGQGKARQDWYWTLIGECYVHGMMDGQARQFQRESRVSCIGDGIFEIR
ncbi:HET-domain-containing protein [Microthyrium microscopicum]|uniref:HET-domain-containing protein n=1 Tax=Microthyrium microscopicum TaxID=703497 RepID=A0A6A6U4E0_9PEZI|nr:HET-domain-containing protein [Microthyrium microscopicum]